ncbi:MAG: Amidohydrolase [Mycobacterium sp.]|nr:Amidohydrolase [Mycobacterium sp.]
MGAGIDTLTHDPAATNWLIERVGADRVMFGTDVPFDMAGGTFAEQTSGYTGGDDALTAIASGNAEALFDLKGVRPESCCGS